MKKAVSVLLALLLLWVSGPSVANAAEDLEENRVAVGDLQTDDAFYLGSYPQTRVTDTQLIVTLNQLDITMESYGYLVNTTEEVGMTYGDVLYEGVRYRKVHIGNTYRPRDITEARNSFSVIDDHKDSVYKYNSNYWFRWEPVKWLVINHTAQGVTAVSDCILDAQSYHNAPAVSINWRDSDIRKWLNTTMWHALFSEGDKAKIVKTDVENPGNPAGGNFIGYSENTLDYLWLLDISELTKENGFGTYPVYNGKGTQYLAIKLMPNVTDYSFCQGMPVLHDTNQNPKSTGYFYLRTVYAPDSSAQHKACYVEDYGRIRQQGLKITMPEGVRPCVTLDAAALVSLTAEMEDDRPCTHPNTLSRVTKPASFQLDGTRQTVCAGCGEVLGTQRINAIETIKLTKKSLLYTNSEQDAPSVQITDSEGKEISPEDYTLTCVSRADGKESSAVKNIGQYKLRVDFRNDYSGTRELYFSVKPQNMKITSVGDTTAGYRVNWKANGAVTGYEVEFSLNSSFARNVQRFSTDEKNCCTCLFRRSSLPQAKLSRLRGKRYYVRIRSYKVVQVDGGEAYMYSPWSRSVPVTPAASLKKAK